MKIKLAGLLCLLAGMAAGKVTQYRIASPNLRSVQVRVNGEVKTVSAAKR
jgi:hypothetical protein